MRAILILGRKGKPLLGHPIRLVNYPAGPLSLPSGDPSEAFFGQDSLGAGGEPWMACVGLNATFAMHAPSVPLSDLAEICAGVVPYRQGRGRPPQTAEVVATKPYTFCQPEIGTTPILRGRQVRRYMCKPAQEYAVLGKNLASVGRHKNPANGPRVFVRELCARDGCLVAAVAHVAAVPRYGLFSIELGAGKLGPHALAALLNSETAARYVRATCDGYFKESFNRIRGRDLKRLPIPLSLLAAGKYGAKLEAMKSFSFTLNGNL